MLNEYALGQSCPSLGVTVPVDHSVPSTLDIKTLSSRLKQAFITTRWAHPTVATQVKDSKELVYRVHDTDGVATWAKRTVQYVEAPGGWLAKYEELSREAVLPTAMGDCALLYLVTSPDQASKSQITEFNLLLHVHHSLVDGTGLRSIMDYILTELATSDSSISFSWGEEVDRLQPSALDAAPISDEMLMSLAQMPKEIAFPPLVKPEEARSGTCVVTYAVPNAHNGETDFHNQFDDIYQDKQSMFKLNKYQLVTDESTPRLSCRSHSWNGELVLGISFSYKHHTRDSVQGFLDKWARLLESLGQSDTTGISGDVTDHSDI